MAGLGLLHNSAHTTPAHQKGRGSERKRGRASGDHPLSMLRYSRRVSETVRESRSKVVKLEIARIVDRANESERNRSTSFLSWLMAVRARGREGPWSFGSSYGGFFLFWTKLIIGFRIC